MKLVSMKEKHNRDYYIEYFNELSLKELQQARTQNEKRIVVEKNINVHKLLEEFIKPNEFVDFYHIQYLLDNATNIGFKAVRIM